MSLINREWIEQIREHIPKLKRHEHPPEPLFPIEEGRLRRLIKYPLNLARSFRKPQPDFNKVYLEGLKKLAPAVVQSEDLSGLRDSIDQVIEFIDNEKEDELNLDNIRSGNVAIPELIKFISALDKEYRRQTGHTLTYSELRTVLSELDIENLEPLYRLVLRESTCILSRIKRGAFRDGDFVAFTRDDNTRRVKPSKSLNATFERNRKYGPSVEISLKRALDILTSPNLEKRAEALVRSFKKISSLFYINTRDQLRSLPLPPFITRRIPQADTGNLEDLLYFAAWHVNKEEDLLGYYREFQKNVKNAKSVVEVMGHYAELREKYAAFQEKVADLLRYSPNKIPGTESEKGMANMSLLLEQYAYGPVKRKCFSGLDHLHQAVSSDSSDRTRDFIAGTLRHIASRAGLNYQNSTGEGQNDAGTNEHENIQRFFEELGDWVGQGINNFMRARYENETNNLGVRYRKRDNMILAAGLVALPIIAGAGLYLLYRNISNNYEQGRFNLGASSVFSS